MGKLKGEESMTIQAYRFPKSEYTVEQAKEWLKKEGVKTIEFEAAKKDSIDIVTRNDFLDENIVKTFKINEHGYLTGRAIVTNVGVFSYRLPGGKIQRELRLPEEVFDWDSLESMKRIPVTDNHPKEMKVTIDNVKKLQKGFVGSEITNDPYHVSADVTITDSDLIDTIRVDRKTALSCGYDTVLEYTPGVWMGVEYDAIQRNIRYNHLAVVDAGRAGDAAKIKLDHKSKTGGKGMDLKKINIDGVEFEAEATVIQKFNQTKTDYADLQKKYEDLEKQSKSDSAKLQAERDEYKDELDKAKTALDNAEKMSPEKLNEAVNNKMVLLGAAKTAGVEIKQDWNDITIKKEIIKKLNPASAEKVDSADDIYIEARFDVALEKLEELSKETEKTNVDLKDDSLANKDIKNDVNSARERMKEAALNQWKSEIKGA